MASVDPTAELASGPACSPQGFQAGCLPIELTVRREGRACAPEGKLE